MIIKEVLESLKRNRTITVVIIMQFVVSLMLMTIVNYEFEIMKNKKSGFEQTYLENKYYRTVDQYYNEDEKEFISQKNHVALLKDFYQDLNDAVDFNYIDITFQPVYIKDLKGGEKYFYGYENGIKPELVEFKNDGKYSSVKAIQLNMEAFEQFGLEVMEGKEFKQKDFDYVDGKILPVMLGYEYEGLYSIGDNIRIKHLAKDFEAVVIGILKRDSSVLNSDLVYIDRYIIMPSINVESFPENYEEQAFQRMLYFQKNNGLVTTNRSADYVQSRISELCKKNYLKDYYVIGAEIGTISIAGLEIEDYINISWMMVLGIMLFSVISLSATIVNKIMTNMKLYTTHLICGASMTDIIKYVLGEVALIVSAANLISMVILRVLGFTTVASLGVVALSYVMGMVGVLLPMQTLFRRSFVEILAGKD